jgi:hypothetical protein
VFQNSGFGVGNFPEFDIFESQYLNVYIDTQWLKPSSFVDSGYVQI